MRTLLQEFNNRKLVIKKKQERINFILVPDAKALQTALTSQYGLFVVLVTYFASLTVSSSLLCHTELSGMGLTVTTTFTFTIYFIVYFSLS